MQIDQKKTPTRSKTSTQNIAVFGLGKVGLTLVSCLSNAGNRVIGVDISQKLVESLNTQTIYTDEPGVMSRLESSFDQISGTIDTHEAVAQSEMCFIIVPTPSNTFGAFSLRYVLSACESIASAIKTLNKDNYVISLVSTVFPGSSEQIIIPKLEQISGRKVGEGIGYCYNPSFIALGEIVKGMETPDYLLIGESSSKAGDVVLKAHQSMITKEVPIARMHPIEAEITKLASNTHETMRVSFANMLLSACSEIPSANVDRITGALSHRMGSRFFKGAIPFGGPCWPRDNKALALFLEMVGVPSRMPRNVDIFNDEHGRYILRKILEISNENSKIGIIGLAYKAGTYFIERSYSVDLIQWLLDELRVIIGWDPMALEEVKKIIQDKMSYASTGNDCLHEAEIVVIAQPLRELSNLDWSQCKNKTVIDCWRCLNPDQISEVGSYIPLGHGQESDPTSLYETHLKKRLELITK